MIILGWIYLIGFLISVRIAFNKLKEERLDNSVFENTTLAYMSLCAGLVWPVLFVFLGVGWTITKFSK